MYDGNIRAMYTTLSDDDEMALGTHQTNYTYDQLNRIRSMEGLNRVAPNTLAASSGYRSSYTFDANGNLETLQRYAFGETTAMDSFVYRYNAGTNRLNWVNDLAGASLFADVDIDNSMDSSNYDYDAIGQLEYDPDEGIDRIFWTVTNKVEEIIYSDGSILHFDYDPMGNRIAKHLYYGTDTTSTYYFLDAQEEHCDSSVKTESRQTLERKQRGNKMCLYEYADTDQKVYLSEHNIYGSSRIGQEQLNKEMEGNSYTYTGLLANEVGDKRYELSNHLGNVLEVVTDRKLPSSSYYYGYNFNTGLDGWAACTQAIVSQADGQLQISSYGASNCTYILQTTVIGESYTVMIRSNRGTAPGLRLALFGIGTTNLIDGENTWITFTATSTTTGLIIEPTSTAASYVYYVDAVEIYQNSRYVADVVSYSDYYPYGMQMPGRHESSGDYRYGFAGKEKDDQIKGNANQLDFGARTYDPRIGRWLSRDPLAGSQPNQSPYKGFLNNPILFVDPVGETEYPAILIYDKVIKAYIKIDYTPVKGLVMTDGEVYTSGNDATWSYYQKYYDYEAITVITINEDGSYSVSKPQFNILYEYGVVDTDVGRGGESYTRTVDYFRKTRPDRGREVSFGFVFHGTNAGAIAQDYTKNVWGHADWDDISSLSSIGKGLTDLRHTFKSGSWQNGWKAGFQPTAKDFKRMFKFINSRFKNGEKLGKLFEQIVGELEKRTYEPDAKGNERSAERLFKCEGCGEEMPASDTTRHSNPLQPSNGGGPYKEVETNDDQ